MSCGSKHIFRNAPYTHHDVIDLVNHGMVKNTKTWISWEWNITLLWNKEILNLCLIWHILRSYRFVAEVTFKEFSLVRFGWKGPKIVFFAFFEKFFPPTFSGINPIWKIILLNSVSWATGKMFLANQIVGFFCNILWRKLETKMIFFCLGMPKLHKEGNLQFLRTSVLGFLVFYM